MCNEEKHFCITELEELIKLSADECKQKLVDYVSNYKKEIADKEKQEQLFKGRFEKLGIPKAALDCPVRETANCERLLFGKIYSWRNEEEWYTECNQCLDISWDAKTLYDVLKEIEKVSKEKIINFGLSSYDYVDDKGHLLFERIEGKVILDECADSFNLQLSNGNYYHLYFCESK